MSAWILHDFYNLFKLVRLNDTPTTTVPGHNEGLFLAPVAVLLGSVNGQKPSLLWIEASRLLKMVASLPPRTLDSFTGSCVSGKQVKEKREIWQTLDCICKFRVPPPLGQISASPPSKCKRARSCDLAACLEGEKLQCWRELATSALLFEFNFFFWIQLIIASCQHFMRT